VKCFAVELLAGKYSCLSSSLIIAKLFSFLDGHLPVIAPWVFFIALFNFKTYSGLLGRIHHLSWSLRMPLRSVTSRTAKEWPTYFLHSLSSHTK
jgi:hypothetical protein